MTLLTKAELDTIQAWIEKKVEQAAELGLTMHVDDDLRKWKEHAENAPNGGTVSRTLDPTVNDVRPGNSFWVYLKDARNRIVVCHANRFLEVDDFVQEYICTHRFFGNRCPTLHHFPVELCESVPVLGGRIDFGGGTWVHPDYRGKKLSGLISRMGRILALRHFLIDYYVGFITATGKRRQYGSNGLGLGNRRHLLTGRYPGRNSDLDVDIYWMHRGELMSQITQELAGESGGAAAPMRRTA
ncbi:MAG: hypothetical protein GKS00_16375 [Alphaproteobacteria bacterium]|nr:hypothetical protein [Alphaproteobacteria bacterium]